MADSEPVVCISMSLFSVVFRLVSEAEIDQKSEIDSEMPLPSGSGEKLPSVTRTKEKWQLGKQDLSTEWEKLTDEQDRSCFFL